MDKGLKIYLAVAFIPVWGSALAHRLAGLEYGASPLSMAIIAGWMLMPAAGVLLARLFSGEGFRNGWGIYPRFCGNWKSYFMSWWVPLVWIVGGGAVYFFIRPGFFTGAGIPAVYLVQLVIGFLIAPVANLLFTLGEELGWRTYLLPKLCQRHGVTKAVILSGVIWGIWHAPAIAMGHNYGVEYAGYPWFGIGMMIIFCVTVSCFMSYVTIRVKSVFPAAVTHSVINACAASPILFTTGGDNLLLGPTILGLLGGSVLYLCAIWSLWKLRGLPQEESMEFVRCVGLDVAKDHGSAEKS